MGLLYLILFLTVPLLVYCLAGKYFETHALKSPLKSLLAVLAIAVLCYAEYLLFFEMPFSIILLPLGFLALGMMAVWVLIKPEKQISLRQKLLVCIPIFIALLMAPWMGWRIYRNQQSGFVRSKVARAKSEIRNLAVALETYYIENNTYPPAVDEAGKVVPFASDGVPVSSGYVSWMLTTPVVHQASLPTDPFNKKDNRHRQTYRYASDGKTGWILTSQGPDFDPDMNLANYIRDASCQIEKFLTQYGGDGVEYDPTNGVLSSGDVFRTGP